MKDLKKKKTKKELPEDEVESKDSRGFEALAELTSSDVVQQVKMGMGRIAPLELEETEEGPAY